MSKRRRNNYPTQNIRIIVDEDGLNILMKDGEIFKNTVVDESDPAFQPVPEMRIKPGDVVRRGQ